MPQRIKMAITTHTAMIVTLDESLFCFSAVPLGIDIASVEEIEVEVGEVF